MAGEGGEPVVVVLLRDNGGLGVNWGWEGLGGLQVIEPNENMSLRTH